jgi:hypothetical protein
MVFRKSRVDQRRHCGITTVVIILNLAKRVVDIKKLMSSRDKELVEMAAA